LQIISMYRTGSSSGWVTPLRRTGRAGSTSRNRISRAAVGRRRRAPAYRGRIDDAQVDRYLARIGADRPSQPDAAALRELQLRHLLSVPFENLSIHLGEPIVLDEEALFAKVVDRHRGGFCYELNGLFAALLSALGYEVTLLAARVFGGDRMGPPFDHMALRVGGPQRWLVDVGFGAHSHHPLRLELGLDQPDPAGTFRITTTDEGDLDVHLDGQPQYRAEPRPRALPDYEPTCWWHQTSPRSHFTRGPVCSLMTATGRVTLNDRRLIVTHGAERAERELAGEDEVLDAYRAHFGIALERVPAAPRPPVT
jgi:N-hydroxyarylamine O-acetyltransferase